jgi:hypothetical protein
VAPHVRTNASHPFLSRHTTRSLYTVTNQNETVQPLKMTSMWSGKKPSDAASTGG